jgi:hypothetical protein
MQNKTENWLKRSVQSDDASLSDESDGSQGGNRAGDETSEGTVEVGSPIGDGIILTLLLAGAYVIYYLPGQKEKTNRNIRNFS